jgi:hypothetical protein
MQGFLIPEGIACYKDLNRTLFGGFKSFLFTVRDALRNIPNSAGSIKGPYIIFLDRQLILALNLLQILTLPSLVLLMDGVDLIYILKNFLF